MQKHWKALQWASLVAMMSIVVSIMYGWYFLTYGLLLTAGVYFAVYLIGVAKFKGRFDSDSNGEQGRAA